MIEDDRHLIFDSVTDHALFRDICDRIIMPVQTHTVNVGVIDDSNANDALSGGIIFGDTDALVSFVPGIAVAVRTADCVPVMLHAPDIRAVAAIHAGWRGTIGGIVANAVKVMTDRGADRSAISAFIGTAICGDCYEVSEELAASFSEKGFGQCLSLGRDAGKDSKPRMLDLRTANRLILLRCGLSPENIRVSPFCTRHTFSKGVFPYPSWRREPGTLERLVSAILLK